MKRSRIIWILVVGAIVFGYMDQEDLAWRIVELITAIFTIWYYIAHRRFNSCPKCKRYSNIEKHIMNSRTDRMRYKVKAAVEWIEETIV